MLAAVMTLASPVSIIGNLWSETVLFGLPSTDQAFYKLLLGISDRSMASRLGRLLSAVSIYFSEDQLMCVQM